MENIPWIQFYHDLIEEFSHTFFMGKHQLGLVIFLGLFLWNTGHAQVSCGQLLKQEVDTFDSKFEEVKDILDREPKLKDIPQANPKVFGLYMEMIFSALYTPVMSRAEIGKAIEGDPKLQRGEGLHQFFFDGNVEGYYSQHVNAKVEKLMFSVQNQLTFLKHLKKFEAKNEDVLVESLYEYFISELKKTNAQIPKDAPPEAKRAISDQVDLLMFELGELTFH